MGLFTKDTKVKLAPRTQESLYGGEYLQNLLGQAPTIPLQGTAELTPVQQMIQQMLPEMIGQTTEAGQLARDWYTDLLSSDVTTDPRYEALKIQAEQNARAAETAAKRLGEGQGVLHSTPTQQKIYTDVAATQSPLLAMMGQLESEKYKAAEGIQKSQTQELSDISAVHNIAEMQRLVDQQSMDALYNQVLQSILFPYQYQSQLANQLMTYSPGHVVTGGGLTDLGFGLNLASQFGGQVLGGLLSRPPAPQNLGQYATGVHVP